MLMFRLAPDADLSHVFEILNSLPDRIPQIAYWQLGLQEGEPDGTDDYWDMSLIADFTCWNDLNIYSKDSYHLEVIEKSMPMFTARAVIDYEFSP